MSPHIGYLTIVSDLQLALLCYLSAHVGRTVSHDYYHINILVRPDSHANVGRVDGSPAREYLTGHTSLKLHLITILDKRFKLLPQSIYHVEDRGAK